MSRMNTGHAPRKRAPIHATIVVIKRRLSIGGQKWIYERRVVGTNIELPYRLSHRAAKCHTIGLDFVRSLPGRQDQQDHIIQVAVIDGKSVHALWYAMPNLGYSFTGGSLNKAHDMVLRHSVTQWSEPRGHLGRKVEDEPGRGDVRL